MTDARRLVESVPNFSEGREAAVVDALAKAVESSPGVRLLDRTSDPDHNRSVLTFAGDAEAVLGAAQAVTTTALGRIDLRRHSGQHPRIGAVDVVPFVPIGATTMDECIELARRFGRWVAETHEVPVYLYARAASRSERTVLADIRRPQFEGLAELVAQPGWEPDFGPARLHPSAGAMAVGARPFLIAYNIELETSELEIAKRIAHRIRERSGGLPRVQALGLWLEERHRAQVSMNLLDHTVTPIWQVWEAVEGLAASQGVRIRDSELIGLIPEAALLEVADHIDATGDDDARISAAASWLRIRDFSIARVLERRLLAGRAASGRGRGRSARGRGGAGAAKRHSGTKADAR